MTSARAREFRDRGFVTVKGLLPRPEAETYVRHLERLSGRTRESFEKYRVGRGVLQRGVYRGWTLPDGVSKTREFWALLVHPGLLGVVREELGYSALDPELVERLRRAGLHADVDHLPHDPEVSTYRPGRLQKLLGRRIRPGARAA